MPHDALFEVFQTYKAALLVMFAIRFSHGRFTTDALFFIDSIYFLACGRKTTSRRYLSRLPPSAVFWLLLLFPVCL